VNCQETREAAAVALLTRAKTADEVSVHLNSCQACRSDFAELHELIPLLEMADQTPRVANNDEVSLQRLLAAVRADARPAKRRRLVAAVAAGVIFLGLSTGWLAAATRHPDNTVHSFSALSDTTGVRATVDVSSLTSGSLLRISVSGVAPGTTCRLDVISTSGTRATAATWLADYHGAGVVVTAVATPRSEISQVDVVDVGSSRALVTIPVSF
jgi:anti-sigma factor RsiW